MAAVSRPCTSCGGQTTAASGLCTACRRRGKPCPGCGGWTGQSARSICASCYRRGEEEIVIIGYNTDSSDELVAANINAYRNRHAISGRHQHVSPGGIIFRYARLGLITQDKLLARYDKRSSEKAREAAAERSPGWDQKRKEALERNGHKCAVCAATSQLEVHHIDRFARVKKHDLENLITLCETCHQSFGIESAHINYEEHKSALCTYRDRLTKYQHVIALLGWQLRIVGVVDSHKWRSRFLIRPFRTNSKPHFAVCAELCGLVLPEESKKHPKGIMTLPESDGPLLVSKEKCQHGHWRLLKLPWPTAASAH
jgi:hypothetical protein